MHSETGDCKRKGQNSRNRRFKPEEDALIKDLVENKHISPWSAVAKHLPGRTGPQCRDRYNSYLYEDTISKKWSTREDEIIISKYREFGPRWVLISQFLPGRNGNSVKNRWHKSLVKYHGIKHKEVKIERRSKNLKHNKTPTAESPISEEADVQPSMHVEELENLSNSVLSNVFTNFDSESDISELSEFLTEKAQNSLFL